MKQTKKKSQKSEKEQPINVQLSKQDLMELLTVLKEFTSAEITNRNKRFFLNQSEMYSRIISLEGKERQREIKRISYCPHKIFAFKSVQYLKESSVLSSVTYRCESCGSEWLKLPCFLTRKEKKALKNLGVRV